MERLNYAGTRKLPDFFSQGEISLILQQLAISEDYWKGSREWGEFFKIRDITIISTIYLLGLRPKEACCLKFSDFKDGWVKIDGRNNKVRKDRNVPVPQSLNKILHRYLEFPRSRFWKGSKYLFPSFESPHISPKRVECILREKALKPLGLWEMPEKRSSHRTTYKLRHSFATHKLNKQIKKYGKPDIFSISNFLGHSDIRSTQVYLHTDESYNKYLEEQMDL